MNKGHRKELSRSRKQTGKRLDEDTSGVEGGGGRHGHLCGKVDAEERLLLLVHRMSSMTLQRVIQ